MRHFMLALSKDIRLWRLILGGLLFFSVAAQAKDHIVARSMFEDTSSQLSWEQVQGQPFKPFSGLLSAGIGASVLWVKLRIDPAGLQLASFNDDRLLLRLRPVYLDRIELFDPLDHTGKPRITGDHHPIQNDEVKSLLFGFLIHKGNQPRDIYLKIMSTSTRMLYAEAIPLSEYSDHGRPYQIATGLYLGFNLMFIVWALVMWVIGREALVLSYLIAQLAALLVGLTLTGYLRFFVGEYLGVMVIDHLTSFAVLLAVASASWFYLTLLREFSPPRWGIRFLQSSFWLFGIELLLLAMDHTRDAITLNWLYLSVFPAIMLLTVIFSRGWSIVDSRSKPVIPRPIMLGYFWIMFSFYLLNTLGGLGVFQVSLLTMYFGLINCFLSGILTLTLLQYRFVLNEQNNARLLAQLALSQQKIEQERLHRQDQESLLAMLAHELKTALSIVAIALQTRNDRENNLKLAGAAVTDMRDIIDQCLEVDRFNGTNLQLGMENVNIATLIAEIQSKIAGLAERTDWVFGPTQFVTDARLFKVIVLNLLNNAMRYSQPDTPIHCRIEAADEGVALTVNNLPGVAGWPDPERLFAKYYRAPGAYRLTGTGLGLYLSRQMAQRLGGDLCYVPSSTHIGFLLWLPSKTL